VMSEPKQWNLTMLMLSARVLAVSGCAAAIVRLSSYTHTVLHPVNAVILVVLAPTLANIWFDVRWLMGNKRPPSFPTRPAHPAPGRR
jgi:hypothetical protein